MHKTQRRDRLLKVNRLGQLLAKGSSAGTVFLAVPLVLKSLGTNDYGVWATITSVLALLMWADLGLGSGLVTKLVKANANNDKRHAAAAYSTTFWMLIVMSVSVFAICSILLHVLDVGRMLHVDASRIVDAKNATFVILALFFASIPFSLVDRVRISTQENYFTSLFQACASMLTLGGYWLCSRFELGMPWFALAMLGPPLLGYLVNQIILFGQYPWLLPKPANIRLELIGSLASTGGLFLALYSLYSIIHGSDNVIIAKVSGADAVAGFSVHARLATLLTVLCMIIAAPLWGALGEAIATNDYTWMRRCVYRSLSQIGGIAICVSIGLLIFLPQIFALWLGRKGGIPIAPSVILLGGVLTWSFFLVLNAMGSIFLNAASEIKIQVFWAGITFPIVILVKYFSLRLWGVTGMVWCGAVAYFFTSVLSLWVYIYRKYLRLGLV